ncbi:MarR family transcriptional regulator [Bdellovibrio sp. SKB1291214]|uniref:MarR family winged helix-turn-helix transcriptional regulator n=1 Tax=Bdellovibrio sp. SKB1291214 TaxID=1732569 RepID=UPI000B515AD9|nr:MarR family transcriptional regulator [Bdellovibrio sp. SKB1291214]UYL08844.1 MarR family transcriptional regulator [Bdellovibrio sp. SKB1291214]
MAKLFIQDLPTEQELKASCGDLHTEDVDAGILHSNLLFMKVANELDNHFEGVLSKYSLSSGRFTLLYMLRNAPEGLSPSALASMAGVTQATISGLLNNMEKNELIVRETHVKDGRSFVIKLTAKGDSTLKEIFPQWYPRVKSFWEQQFSKEQLIAFKATLEEMIKKTEVLATEG